MEDSSFVFDHINFIDIKFNQIDLVREEKHMSKLLYGYQKTKLLLIPKMKTMRNA